MLLALLAGSALYGQNPNVSAMFTPSSISVNSFSTASFDPSTPWTQPIITTLNIQNTSSQDFKIYLRVEIYWSGVSTPLVNANYLSKEVLPAGAMFPSLTNQDLITNQASGPFNQVGSINFSLDEIVEQSTVLKNAVLAGYFPDGSLSIKIYVQPEDEGYQNWSGASVATFTINVRNAGVIHLINPGVRVGGNPTLESAIPISFIWNAVGTGFNQYMLTIKEFPPNMPPTQNNVDVMGTVFHQQAIEEGVGSFADFLPFNDGYYYAWRIYTSFYSETNPSLRNEDRQNTLSSDWYVFKYASDSSVIQNANEIQAILNMLNNISLQNLYNDGYLPTGTVIYNGRSYTGQDAVDLVETLLGKELEIRVSQ
jgi:hypothetical protein